MNRESSIDIYTLPHVKQRAGEKLLYNTRSPVWCSVKTLGWGEGRLTKVVINE